VSSYGYNIVQALLYGILSIPAHLVTLTVSFSTLQSKAMSSYGYNIVQALVTDIMPDQKVRNAMNEINAAARLR